MVAVGKPEENGYAELLMRTIREEEISLTEYTNFADMWSQLGQLGQFMEDSYVPLPVIEPPLKKIDYPHATITR